MSKHPRQRGNRRTGPSGRVTAGATRQKYAASSRIDTKKHSAAIAYLYDSELLEIENMVQSADKLVEVKR